MSFWSRISNVFRGDGLAREIDEELEFHINEAVAAGLTPSEARKAFGPAARARENSRDIRVIPWLDSLLADTIFAWRRLRKRKVTSAAAVLSLGLAIGACTAAFRLIDALLLRPLPVAHPERLYALFRHGVGFYDGAPRVGESFEYPVYARMRSAVKDDAELLAVSYIDRFDMTWSTDAEMEKAFIQYLSGSTFGTWSIKPALGRLLTPNDDMTPGAHPVAVLSYDYWSRRFGRDPAALGRRFRIVDRDYEVVGVAQPGFTGTEPGTVTEIFLPAMMNSGVTEPGSAWLRIFAQLKPHAAQSIVQDKLRGVFAVTQREEAKEFTGRPKLFIERFLSQKLSLDPAAAGLSNMQQDYRMSLTVLAVLVGLVLLIACANVANLMTVQSAAQSREIALRVSIGAGRGRLIQMVLVESAEIALLAAAAGAAFAWKAAPLVTGMINPPDNPARLILPADWRVVGFGAAIAALVVVLFGLAPALRASAVRPASAIRGGDDPRARWRLLPVLIGAQAAFCFLVHFAGGLFISTFERLSNRPTGFDPNRVLTVVTAARPPQTPAAWQNEADRLRGLPGVESASLAAWALLTGQGRNGFVSIRHETPEPGPTDFLAVSPGWLGAMHIPLLAGRDFRADDAEPGVALVNAAFAKKYFAGAAVGQTFEKVNGRGAPVRYRIAGVAGDAVYDSLRAPVAPTVYIPFNSANPRYAGGTFVLRASSSDPLALAPMLRRELWKFGFRASNIRTENELILRQSVRERLLATLAVFFAGVALLLAGIGLYGVLAFSVLRRRKEIGIRIAIGASPAHIARRVTGGTLAMVLAGAGAGCWLSLALVKYVKSLLFGIEPVQALTAPWLTIAFVVVASAIPAVIRALRIDPAKMLRVE